MPISKALLGRKSVGVIPYLAYALAPKVPVSSERRVISSRSAVSHSVRASGLRIAG